MDSKLLLALLLSLRVWADQPYWKIGLAGCAVALLLVASVGESGNRDAYEEMAVPHTYEAELSELAARALRAKESWGQVEEHYLSEVAPIERVLLRYRRDPDLTRRIALALVREARAVDLDPRLLLAVLLVENPWLDPAARSPAGAIGLMQVMPFHRGEWPPCPADLKDVEGNICYGARIFADYLQTERGDVERALLRYNGCVEGTNTPDCHRYPDHVFARAGRASILAWFSATSGSQRTTPP